MLGSYGVQPIILAFNNSKNCFLHLSANVVTQLCLQENQVLELSCGLERPVFLSWTKGRTSSQEHRVELSRQLGETLGFQEGKQGSLRPCHQVQSVHQVFVEPLSSDDWEILELHSTSLEQHLLDQIRIVFSDGVFPVWVDQRTVIYIKIISLSPSVPYGRLERYTELVVSPKFPRGGKQIPHVTTVGPDPSSPVQQREQNCDLTSTSSITTDSLHESFNNRAGHWGGVADLRGLVRYMFPGRFEPVKEIPEVPTIPAIFQDCILRVCGSPPGAISHLDSSYGDVHLLPWDHLERDHWSTGQAVLTYGRLSKIYSPKEVREQAKQAAERRKGGNDSQTEKDAETPREEPVVVRILCHNVEKLQVDQRSFRMGEIYCGKVWIPSVLRTRLGVDPHSAVKVCPVKCIPEVALAISLQPLQPLAESVGEEDVRSAFLGWLHARSHQPLACLTAQTSTVLLQCSEGKSEFILTVQKPEPDSQTKDKLFLLSTGVLYKADIQVMKECAPLDPTTAGRSGDELPLADSPSLSSLGGVEEAVATAMEHISHSLMRGPLCWELVSMGPGLRSGALLISGAKGSGKTTLSRALCRKAAEEMDAHVEVLDCRKLKGKRADTVRQRLGEVFEQAMWRQPSVVLLDDLDEVTGAAATAEQEQGQEAVLRLHIAQGLMDLVDEAVVRCSLVALLVTAQTEQSLHPTLTQVQGSHFFQSFCKIPTPDQVQRVDILRSLMNSKNITPEDCSGLDLEGIAMKTEGYLPQDLNLLLDRAVHASAVHGRGNGTSEGVRLSCGDFQQALQGFVPPSQWGARLQVPGEVGTERVGGLHQARQLLMDTILLPAKYPRLFSCLPIRQRSGVLLFGAPGTGKTLLAGAVAKESGMNFISIKGPELLSKYIGASEQAVREVFQRAQAAKPCVLFFDEFDSLAPRRGHDSTGVTDRVVNQLLTQLDGVEGLHVVVRAVQTQTWAGAACASESATRVLRLTPTVLFLVVSGVYVLAATSRPDLIDPALLRPGRLDKSVYCPPPDREARKEILKALTHSVPLAADVDLEQIAVATELFTGADLKALLYNAQLEAIHNGLGPSLLPQRLGRLRRGGRGRAGAPCWPAGAERAARRRPAAQHLASVLRQLLRFGGIEFPVPVGTQLNHPRADWCLRERHGLPPWSRAHVLRAGGLPGAEPRAGGATQG
ncbi:peroxisomal ATPase PEX1 isoform X3 [Brachyhypopomus gauderio]|uniref:peroxisomal ATPase PEX1 isoform X3 n=1 Tax=Brachyhypopomus gauderio TaxID=698409 RepID=UPI004041610F